MLQSIRDKAQGWFAWVIISLLIVVFAVWGVGSYFAPDPDPVIIDVDGQETHLREFQREMQSTRQRLRESLGARYNEDLFPVELLRRQVVQRFVNQALLRGMSEAAEMRIGDEQLAAGIRNEAAFQIDGRFSADKYRQLLGYQGMSEAGFEQLQRSAQTVAQIENGVKRTAFATAQEVDRALALIDQTREISHLDFSPGEFADGLELTDAAIEGYYQDHIQEFSEPEQVEVDYLELSLDALADKITVSDDAVAARYEEAKESLKTPETRRARHILVEVAQDADAETLAAAEKKVTDIKARLDAGEDFATVAKETSADPGSAAKGGDLGFFGRKAMVPAFEEAAFSLETGTVSEPVRSPFGFHLIEVTEVKEEQVKPLSEVRERLVREEQLAEAEQQFYELGETLANVAYEQPDSLDPAVDAVGLAIQHAGPFSRDNGKGIAAERVFVDAAFRRDLIDNGTNSEPLELSPTRIVILRVTEHKPATPKPLADVRAEVEKDLRRQEAQKETQRLGVALLELLQAGGDPTKTVADHGREWTSDGLIGRDNRTLPATVIQEAFSVVPPAADSQGGFAGAETGDGGYTLVWVTAVKNGSPEDAEPAKHEGVAAALARRWGEAGYSALISDLRSKAEIKIFLRNIP